MTPIEIRNRKGASEEKISSSGNGFNINDTENYNMRLHLKRYILLQMQGKQNNKQQIFLILHNIRSAHNVGSIFRTADAAGVSQIFITGYTPTPINKFGVPRKDIAKVALGAEKTIAWKYYSHPGNLIKNLKKDSIDVIAVEQAPEAADYRKLKLKKPSAFLFGNEVRGVSRQIRLLCGKTIEIPMYGKKESLNVAVVVGVILFRMRGQ